MQNQNDAAVHVPKRFDVTIAKVGTDVRRARPCLTLPNGQVEVVCQARKSTTQVETLSGDAIVVARRLRARGYRVMVQMMPVSADAVDICAGA